MSFRRFVATALLWSQCSWSANTCPLNLQTNLGEVPLNTFVETVRTRDGFVDVSHLFGGKNELIVGVSRDEFHGLQHAYLYAGGARLDGNTLWLKSSYRENTSLVDDGFLIRFDDVDVETIATVKKAMRATKNKFSLSCVKTACRALEGAGISMADGGKTPLLVNELVERIVRGGMKTEDGRALSVSVYSTEKMDEDAYRRIIDGLKATDEMMYKDNKTAVYAILTVTGFVLVLIAAVVIVGVNSSGN